MNPRQAWRTRDLFGKSNTKLGLVLTFSLPAIDTCPGASNLCKELCYAGKGFYLTKSVRGHLARTMEISKRDDFSAIALDLLYRCKWRKKLFRIHPSGDFYDADYTRKWKHIIQHATHYRFWCYTRSWRNPEIEKELVEIAKLPNVKMWYSCDYETGKPSHTPAGVRLAYMMIDTCDIPDWDPDLYFRVHATRRTIQKSERGVLVCPAENGITDVQCATCKLCFRDEAMPKLAIRGASTQRKPLSLIPQTERIARCPT
jgi:hypothetical protein